MNRSHPATRMVDYPVAFRAAPAALLCGLLAACLPLHWQDSGPRPQAAGQQGPRDDAAVMADVMDKVAKGKADYRIQPSDLIEVSVYQDSDLTRKVRVSQNGTVYMPLVGAVKIGGLTLLEAGDLLSRKLSRYVISPQVSLFIEEYGNKQVYVLGEVNKPGSYPMPAESRLTALEAISVAGGFTAVAGVGSTRVLRHVDGKNQILTVDVNAITKLGQKEKDIPLQPNDVVYVPQSFF